MCVVFKLQGYCRNSEQSFPYITLSPGATFPTTSSSATATTQPFVFSTPQFTIPTVLTIPTTLPPLGPNPFQQFPFLPAPFPLPPPIPQFPNFPGPPPSSPFCPSGVVLCPPVGSVPFPPAPLPLPLPFPPITGGIDPRLASLLRQAPNGCPCIDPRSNIGQNMQANNIGQFAPPITSQPGQNPSVQVPLPGQPFPNAPQPGPNGIQPGQGVPTNG